MPEKMRLIDVISFDKDAKESAKAVIDRDFADKSHDEKQEIYKTLAVFTAMLYERPYIDHIPRPDWTPCADGLPEEGQEVLFETALQVPATDYFGTYKGFYSDGIFWIDNVMHEKKFGISKQSVIAWQPLPEPYNPDQFRDSTKKVIEQP